VVLSYFVSTRLAAITASPGVFRFQYAAGGRALGSGTVPVAAVGVPPTALPFRGAHAPSRAADRASRPAPEFHPNLKRKGVEKEKGSKRGRR
jgi:hypothetical protein